MSDNKIDAVEHGALLDLINNSFRAADIGPHNVIQSLDGEFIDFVLMDENYFVDNWLVQFAIGHVGEKNYFDHHGWSKLTQAFTKGVIVLDANKEPVLVIKKFVDLNLNDEQKAHLYEHSRNAAFASTAGDDSIKDEIIKELSGTIGYICNTNMSVANGADRLSTMIPYDYYISKGIDPIVMKQVIYLRDTYSYNGEPLTEQEEVMKEVERIMKSNQKCEPISKQDRELIMTITEGDFIFHDEGNELEPTSQTDSSKKEKPEESEFDPLA